MTATSGLKLYALYAKSTPLGSLAKTLLASSRWYSQARRLTWVAQAISSTRITYTERSSHSPSAKSSTVLSVRDMPSKRFLFRLVPSERPTGETGFGLSQGLLPTPTVMEDRRKPNGDTVRQKKLMSNLNPFSIQELQPTPTAIDSGTGRVNKSQSPNAKERPTIGMAARMGLLPTPCAQDGKNSTLPPSQEKCCSLIAKVMQADLLPTPMSTDIHHGKRVTELKAAGGDTFHSRANGETRPNGLTDFLDFCGLLLTPSATDGLRANFTMESLKNHNKPNAERSNLSEQIAHKIGGGTSQLNPLFVQEMMGFPADWLVSPFLGGEPKL